MKVISKNRKTRAAWPDGRSGHRVIASENNLYVYGGYSNQPRNKLFRELWRYNFSSGRWTSKTDSEFPDHVASSSTAKFGQYLLVFGGTAFPFGGNNSNELHVLDLLTGDIIYQPTTGDIPDGSYGHGCAIDEVNKKLYIVGGTTGITFSSEVYCLDLTSKEWKHLRSVNKPLEPRYRHEVAFYNNKLFVFGGGTIDTTFTLARVPYFDLATNCWKLAITTEADLGQSCYDFPESRKCHSGVMVPGTEASDPKYIISGGIQGEVQLDDIWSINLRTLQWSKFKSKLPYKVHFHDAALTSSGKMVVFGGLKIDGSHHRRVNDLTVVNVFLPQLQEIAWAAVAENFPQISQLSTKALRSIGVPQEFVKRLL